MKYLRTEPALASSAPDSQPVLATQISPNNTATSVLLILSLSLDNYQAIIIHTAEGPQWE